MFLSSKLEWFPKDCVTKDWSNCWGKFSFDFTVLRYTSTENCLKCNYISQYCCFYSIIDKINAALLSTRPYVLVTTEKTVLDFNFIYVCVWVCVWYIYIIIKLKSNTVSLYEGATYITYISPILTDAGKTLQMNLAVSCGSSFHLSLAIFYNMLLHGVHESLFDCFEDK